MMESGLAQQTDWSHDLFGNSNFSVDTYQQQVADFIYENHDWESENPNFVNQMQTYFGSDWKQKTAEACSWIGLTNEQAP